MTEGREEVTDSRGHTTVQDVMVGRGCPESPEGASEERPVPAAVVCLCTVRVRRLHAGGWGRVRWPATDVLCRYCVLECIIGRPQETTNQQAT